MRAVGADQGATIDLGAIGQLCANAFVGLAEADDVCVQMNRARLQTADAIGQDLEQVRTQQ